MQATESQSIFGPVFLHFFDLHFLAERSFEDLPEAALVELRLATRLAIACSDEVLLPAASFIESDICREVLADFKDLLQMGVIRLVGSSVSLEAFAEEKLSAYRRRSPQYLRYKKTSLRQLAPPFRQKHGSSTAFLREYWLSQLHAGDTIDKLFHSTEIKIPKDVEHQWENVPVRLEKLAFVVEHVGKLLGPFTKNSTIENRLHAIVNKGYFSSYTDELNATVVTDLSYLSSEYEIPVPHRPIPYNAILRGLHEKAPRLLSNLRVCTAPSLLALRNNAEWRSIVAAACVTYDEGRRRRGLAIPWPLIESFTQRKEYLDVLILTALPEERAPFETLIPGLVKTESNCGHIIFRGEVSRGGSRPSLLPYEIGITTLPKMGRVAAATSLARILEHWRPRFVLLVGIAAGRQDRGINLGDVLVAKEVIDYEPQKLHPENDELRPDVYRAAQHLVSVATSVDQPAWQNTIPISRPATGAPTLHVGQVASGDKLIQDASRLAALFKRYPKILGIEMEGGGAAYAAEGVAENQPGFMMIRGVSDLGDENKNDATTKAWRPYAASAAAAFALCMLREGLISSRR